MKIIGMSGLGPETVIVKGGRSRFDVLLQKPFTAGQLLTALHALLDSK
jgi:hypothetical protein